MKKILHLQLFPILSGVQRFSLYLLDGLNRDEFDIWLASKPGGEFVEEVKSLGFHYIPLHGFRHPISIFDVVTFLQLLVIMLREKFDIVHTNSSKPGLLGRLAARLAGVPLIIHTAHGVPFQKDQHPVVYIFYSMLEALGNRFGHKTIYVNNSDRLQCLEKRLINPRKAMSIFNAIPETQNELFSQIAMNRKAAQGDFIIGSTIRFSTQKNAVKLVTAACRACRESQTIRFIFLGDGEHHQLCKAIVKSFQVDNRVLLPGWDNDLTAWLKLFNAFVLYSRWEAMPFSIIEAMSSGLPVIGSAIPSIKELVNEECGYLVPLDDENTLVKTFLECAADPEMVMNKGKKALVRINELCNYQNMISSYRSIYNAS